MTYSELQIQLDLNPDNQIDVLENIDTCQWMNDGYLFVDQEDGQCYLFDDDGQEDDISKVKYIEYCAFECCTSLKNIKIPDSVEFIGIWEFADCTSLVSIKIPSSVKNIEVNTFYNCTSLKEVVFEGKTIDQVKAIDEYPWGIKDRSIIKVES